MTEETKPDVAYRGKQFTVPKLSVEGAVFIEPQPEQNTTPAPADSPIIAALNKPFDLTEFRTARQPVSLGILTATEQVAFKPGSPRTLDLPIKFPGSNFRLPGEFAHLAPLIQRVANYEAAVNPDCYDEYYCYLTVDQGEVKPGKLQREAPCHVDGFQGARWRPKVRGNHTYTVSDKLPTVYYVQPFMLEHLDEAVHDFFYEMNAQVADTNSAHAWRPEPGELTLMDCYTVHRGDEAETTVFRTFIRISFEVRIFDRQGNAHNPLFAYNWPMVPRDIEGLNLVAFRADCDPSLRVRPWQNLDGQAHEDPKARTKPNLKPKG